MTPMFSKRRIVFSMVIVLLATIAYNHLLPRFDDPMEAVVNHAAHLGWDVRELDALGGGYSAKFMWWKAHGRFLVRTEEGRGELYIEVEKPTPFSGWRLVTARTTPLS